jgi:hypothetical protein
MAEILYYPQTLTDHDLNPAVIQFQFYNRTDIKTSTSLECIQLTMPNEAIHPSTVSWDHASFNEFQSVALKDYTSGKFQVTGSEVERAAAWSANNLLQKFASSAANAISDTASVATRQIKNPYLTMLFKGVDFRSFQFQFKFTPYSPDDTQKIDQIIKLFRKRSLPGNQASDGGINDNSDIGNTSPYLKYPAEVDIKYLWRGDENKFLHRFKRSVIDSVNVNYTGQGVFSTMRDGMPSSIVMDVRFVETQIVTAENVSSQPSTLSY